MEHQALLEAAAQHFHEARPLLPMYLHLILSALFPIYTGAHASLSRPSSAAKATKKEGRLQADDEEEEDDEVVQKMEGLTPKDAVIFPITAGIVLAGLYFLIKRYGADMVNVVLGVYFSGIGVYSVGRLINDAVNLIVGVIFPDYFSRNGKLWKVDGTQREAAAQDASGDTIDVAALRSTVPILWLGKFWSIRAMLKQKYTIKAYSHDVMDLKYTPTVVNVLSAIFGVASIAYANLVGKPWWLTNLQGFAVCYNALQFMSPTTFATGALILTGLFFYDIWAVFFTPLMVTVAKNLDVPIKLVFPRPDEPGSDPAQPPKKSYSMLGLGDIVLPGIMIALALRFDLYMFYLKKQTRRKINDDKRPVGAKSEEVEKAPYVPVNGTYGDRIWTMSLPASDKPVKLSASFPKPYFTASMIGYVLGMLTTLGVMSVYQHAQPALLYLVPGVLISLFSAGVLRGELRQMWDYSEVITGEQIEEDDKKEEAKKDEKKDDRTGFQMLKEEIFGAAETESEIEKKKKRKKKKQKEETAKIETGKDSKRSERDDDILLSFSIAKYRPKKQGAGEQGTEKLSASRTSTPSDSSMEDTVIIDSAQ